MKHPIQKYIDETGKTTGDIAAEAEISRMHLWRLMNSKGNFTTGLLARVSKATGIPMADLLPETNEV